MTTNFLNDAIEKSTYIVAAKFRDEAGNAVTPETVTWTLSDANGDTVNGRLDVSETPASTVSIVLSGDDLAILPSVSNERIVTIEATYNSEYGTGLPLKAKASFNVVNLEAVS